MSEKKKSLNPRRAQLENVGVFVYFNYKLHLNWAIPRGSHVLESSLGIGLNFHLWTAVCVAGSCYGHVQTWKHVTMVASGRLSGVKTLYI